jgi:hypothetical protein
MDKRKIYCPYCELNHKFLNILNILCNLKTVLFIRRIEQYVAERNVQEQKRMVELKRKEEQKAVLTEKLARQIYETEVRILSC